MIKDWSRFIATVGLPTLLTLYLLDFIPGLHSPIDRIEEAIAAHTLANRDLELDSLRVLRTICRHQVPLAALRECD